MQIDVTRDELEVILRFLKRCYRLDKVLQTEDADYLDFCSDLINKLTIVYSMESQDHESGI